SSQQSPDACPCIGLRQFLYRLSHCFASNAVIQKISERRDEIGSEPFLVQLNRRAALCEKRCVFFLMSLCEQPRHEYAWHTDRRKFAKRRCPCSCYNHIGSRESKWHVFIQVLKNMI